jgi:hypothetical protein
LLTVTSPFAGFIAKELEVNNATTSGALLPRVVEEHPYVPEAGFAVSNSQIEMGWYRTFYQPDFHLVLTFATAENVKVQLAHLRAGVVRAGAPEAVKKGNFFYAHPGSVLRVYNFSTKKVCKVACCRMKFDRFYDNDSIARAKRQNHSDQCEISSPSPHEVATTESDSAKSAAAGSRKIV